MRSDFEYGAGNLPRWGAIIQATYASRILGAETGKVFFTRIHVYDDPQVILTDIVEIDL